MFETSDTTDKLELAICKMQNDFKPLIKDKVNPFFKSKYATLDAVLEATKDARHKHQVTVTQWPHRLTDGTEVLTTRIAHAGQWMQATTTLFLEKHSSQSHASACTLTKRTAFTAAVGIAAEEDTDGNVSANKTINEIGREVIQNAKDNYLTPRTIPIPQAKGPPQAKAPLPNYAPTSHVKQPPPQGTRL